MAVPKRERFPMEFERAYPRGLVLVGEIGAGTERQSQEDRSRGREPRPLVDEQTGKRVWKATVTDPDEGKAARASFEVNLLADVQPVPPTQEVMPGMRPIALEGLMVEPRVAGQGEFRYLAYHVWATGLVDPAAGSARASKAAAPTGSGKDTGASAREAA